MNRLCAAAATLAVILTAQAEYAPAHPQHNADAIAYVSDRDTPADATEFIDEVYLLDPQTRAVQRLTFDVPGVERWPTISPDGRSLAWVRLVFDDSGIRQDLSEIFRCDLRHRAGAWSCHRPRKVVGPVQENAITWTPDSRTILSSGPVTTDADLDADIYAEVAQQSQERTPSFSPDGHKIAFWWFADLDSGFPAGFTDGEIYSMRADGSGVRNLTDNNPTDSSALTKGDIHPDWGPSPARGRHN